jgi:hypothetical protein
VAENETTFNVPRKVTIRRAEFSVREVPYAVFKTNLKQIYDLVKEIREANPDVVWSEIDVDTGTRVFFASFTEIMDGLAESFETLIAAAVERDVEDVRELPASIYIELFARVVEHHAPVVRSFFAARDRLTKMWQQVGAQDGSNGTDPEQPVSTGTGMLGSSTDSSPEGSASPTASG